MKEIDPDTTCDIQQTEDGFVLIFSKADFPGIQIKYKIGELGISMEPGEPQNKPELHSWIKKIRKAIQWI